MKKRNAFTLIELLAVILVIAIPRILDVIETSKKDSFKNSAQLIADSAEKKKVSDKLLGKDEEITCKDVAKINKEDYSKCTIFFDENGIAKVSILGRGKFKGLKVIEATKTSAEVIKLEAPKYGITAVEYINGLYEYDSDMNNLKIDNAPDANIRYYGSNPNNYVKFNNELWRIIGVFGNNVKLIRNDRLGWLSWNSSESSVNGGWGVNEWSQSALKNYLNTMYYGGTSVTCYNGQNNQTTTCPTGTIDETSKGLIDYHTWNTGAPNYNKIYNSTTESYDTVEFYKAERGNETGRICNGGDACNDTVERTTTWTGYIGLPYVTDWAYASSENDCNTKIDQSSTHKCKNNNWLQRSIGTWYLSPYASSGAARYVWVVFGDGRANGYATARPLLVFPTIYLKSNILIESGKGTSSNPYILKAGS